MPPAGPLPTATFGQQTVLHRPGPGAVVAIVGLGLFMLSLFVLPWVSGGGEDATLPEIGDALEAADDTGTMPADEQAKSDFIQGYATWVGLAVLTAMGIGVVFSTLVILRSPGLRALVGLLAAGCLGLIIGLADRDGTVGTKVIAALAAVGAGAAHVYAYWILFLDPDPAPDPAIGVWVGFAGVVAVLTGSLIGTRTVRA